MTKSMRTIAAVAVVVIFTVGAFAGEGGDKTQTSEQRERDRSEFQKRDLTLRLQILDKQYEVLAMRELEAELTTLDLKMANLVVIRQSAEEGKHEILRERDFTMRVIQEEKIPRIQKMMEMNREQAQILTEEMAHAESASNTKEGK